MWPWDGLQPSGVRPAPVVGSGCALGPPGDAQVRSCNVDSIEPARSKVGCYLGPSSRDCEGLMTSSRACPTQNSSYFDPSFNLEWFDRTWGGGVKSRSKVVGRDPFTEIRGPFLHL
jgi:hypothetical protein